MGCERLGCPLAGMGIDLSTSKIKARRVIWTPGVP